MAVIKLYCKNPNDGTDSFDKVKWYEADDSSGTSASALQTGGVDVETSIDISTVEAINPGYTTYMYQSGDTSKYYASTWYNSTSGAETGYSDWTQGGQDKWDEKFKQEMDDTSSEVWSSDMRAEFKKDALDSLFPDFFREVIDTSLTIQNETDNQTYIYTVPFGIFNISEVGVGNTDTDSSNARDFEKVKNDYWTFEKNKLHFHSLSGLNDGETIRLIASKKYLDVGEVPEYLDPLAMLHMKMNAYLDLANDYPRFKKWGRLQKGTRVSFENLRVQAREFERKFKEKAQALKQNPYASLL